MTTTHRVAEYDWSVVPSTALFRYARWSALLGVAAAFAVALLRAPQLSAATGPMQLSTSGAGFILWIALGAVPGGVIGLLGATAPAAAASRGLFVGLLWWAAWDLTLVPLLIGERPQWGTTAVSAAFPDLVASFIQGALTGLLWGLVVPHLRRRPAPAAPAGPMSTPRIVVVGGGFAGLAVAQRFERLGRHRSRWDVTLVSDSNFLLFTPMLSEVAGGALQAQHVGAALRAMCPRTRFLLGRVEGVDLATRQIRLASRDVPFDHLVIALGAEPASRGLPGISEYCLTLKSLRDAARVREHVLTQLERADSEPVGDERRRLLTFAVVGGGFAGVELVAELRDLAYSTLRYFPTLDGAELRFVLVHAGDRLLPELGPELAAFAYQQLAAPGLDIRLGTRVRGATEDALLLEDGTDIPTRTMVWTAGNQPSALVRSLPVEHARGGSVVVDAALRVVGAEGVWAAGDCAAVPDGAGGRQPPTAQHALREGRQLADNLAAVIEGREPQPFRFKTIGMLAVLGHRTGVAEFRGRRFSGVLAWALWRVIYLSKLPGLEKRVRVALDWLIEIGFPRDIVLAQEVVVPSPPPANAVGAAAGDRR